MNFYFRKSLICFLDDYKISNTSNVILFLKTKNGELKSNKTPSKYPKKGNSKF
jgi:hypothetical protein